MSEATSISRVNRAHRTRTAESDQADIQRPPSAKRGGRARLGGPWDHHVCRPSARQGGGQTPPSRLGLQDVRPFTGVVFDGMGAGLAR
eukprot:8804492-Pyramimonas_sp.AAC.1